jgi:hypothetical protein
MTKRSPAKPDGHPVQDILAASTPGPVLLSKDVMEHVAIACMLCGADELMDDNYISRSTTIEFPDLV